MTCHATPPSPVDQTNDLKPNQLKWVEAGLGPKDGRIARSNLGQVVPVSYTLPAGPQACPPLGAFLTGSLFSSEISRIFAK